MADAARLVGDVRFRLLSRPGTKVEPDAFGFPENVEVDHRVWGSLEELWLDAHAVVAPFRNSAKRKSVPNSVIEGLAAGRPAIVTDAVPIADWIEAYQAGVVCEPTGEGLAAAVTAVRNDYATMADNAATHGIEFSVDRFRRAYLEVYRRITRA